MVIDEGLTDAAEAAANTRISKTHNNGSGCSCDGNLLVEATIYDKFLEQLQKEGGYLASEEDKKRLQAVMWDAERHRDPGDSCPSSVERSPNWLDCQYRPRQTTSIIVEGRQNRKKNIYFRATKLSPVLSIFQYSGFDNALKMVEQIFEVSGKGHSCGIYSFDNEHIHRLALMAPVSQIMVRQTTRSRGNAGSFTNGMPMTASLGCGAWGWQYHAVKISA